MTKIRFNKPFTQQEAIPQAGIDAAVALMQTGRLHRYNTIVGETAAAAQLESEYAEYMGQRFCLACTSGGYAMHVALKAAGLQAGEPVLTNAFTLAPVPGAIDNAGGKPVLIEIDANYCVDLAHLESQMQQSGARFFMLSHMRGHIADMDAITELCERHDVILIEDCAHTMGATWNGKRSGSFGKVACFSTQTYKHMNSGEGGLLTTDDDDIMARAIIYSGSYMLYERHGAAPDLEAFNDIRLDTPNYSGRMDNLRATLLLAQMPELEHNCKRWNDRYQTLQSRLSASKQIQLPHRPEAETYVGSSLQFRIDSLQAELVAEFIAGCAARGVELKWFGGAEPQEFTSRYDSWRYIEEKQHLPNTLAILANTFDLRIPLTFSVRDMDIIGDIIIDEAKAVVS
jgi:dTDP-4-amino-4,6-dideoxygalactose transaminase